MEGIQNVLLPLIAAGMVRHHLTSIGDLYPVHEGMEEQRVIGALYRDAVTVGLERDQTQPVGLYRQRATAGEGLGWQGEQVGTLLFPEFPDSVALATQPPTGFSQASFPEKVVQFLPGIYFRHRDQEVATGVAYQAFYQSLLMGLPRGTESALEQVVTAEGDESLPFLRALAYQSRPDRLGEIVVPDVVGHTPKESKGLLVAGQESFLLLMGKGYQEGELGVAEADTEEV